MIALISIYRAISRYIDYRDRPSYNTTAYVVKMLRFMLYTISFHQYTILPLVFHLICVDYVLNLS